MKRNILVLIPFSEENRKLLEGKDPTANFEYETRETVSREQVKAANIIIGNPAIEMVKGSKNLELLQLESAGVGKYADKDVLPDNVVLTNATGSYGLAISEHMLAVLLELYKKLYLYRDNQARQIWKHEGEVKSIYKSTALIVGLGDIGGEFARRVKALGAYTIGVRRKNANKPDYLDELHFMEDLETLLPRADIVTLSLPATKLTNKIINERTLKLMKDDAVLINVGRGNAVDTDALCDALENGHLLGAALDVTDPEPLPEGHRLWRIKNAVITPHVSGGYSLHETYERIVRLSIRNLEAFIAGKDVVNVINRSEGY